MCCDCEMSMCGEAAVSEGMRYGMWMGGDDGEMMDLVFDVCVRVCVWYLSFSTSELLNF